MDRNKFVYCFLVLTLAVLGGCSSGPATKESKKAASPPEKIQGRAQVTDAINQTETAMSAGGNAMFIWEGVRRYRLFVRAPVELVHGKQYVAEGVYAQKAIDEIGDPDQGKNGYPLPSSCEQVVRMAWSSLGFYEADELASVLRQVVSRHPARPVFLVTRLSPVEAGADSAESKKDAEVKKKDLPEVTVAADKQRALLIEGPAVLNAPLWQPAGGTARCKVLIDEEGKISELQTGVQLCEAVPWSQFRYQPPVQGGRPVNVKTEVEVRFEPLK